MFVLDIDERQGSGHVAILARPIPADHATRVTSMKEAE
jgi:hypothetical protein